MSIVAAATAARSADKINIHDARRQKAEVKAKMAKMLSDAGGRDLTTEENKRWTAMLSEASELDAKIADQEARSGVSLSVSHHTESVSRAFGNSLREVYARATQEVRDQIDGLAAALSGRFSAAADLRPSGDGGLIIPSSVQAIIERNYTSFAPVVSVARLFTTDNGEPTTFPVLSDSESAVQLDAAASTGADATVSGDTPPTDVTGPQLKAWKVSSKPVFVPRELISDSPVDIVSEVIGALLARIIRFENLKYTKGNGTTEAEGFTTNATSYHAGSVALDLDIALDLAYSVPALYRPNGVYMASDTTIKYLRKLHTGISGDKRALWKDAFEEGNATLGTPAKLHGYSILVNNDMDSVASDGTFAGVSPLAFGDFSRFVVRQAENNAPFAYIYAVPAKDGRAAILFRRSDSKLLVSTAISKLVV
jgi:HK97 family phage major capsid protein